MSESEDQQGKHQHGDHSFSDIITGSGHRWILLATLLGAFITFGFYALWFYLVVKGLPRPTNMDALAMGGVATVIAWVFGKGIQEIRRKRNQQP